MTRALLLALMLTGLGCGEAPGQQTPSPAGAAGIGGAGGTSGAAGTGGGGAFTLTPAPSWTNLPAVTAPDPELAGFEKREAQYQKLCAAPRRDSFFKRICGEFRPNIPDLVGLLGLVGLGESRAFALTGNSTSLVAKSVSAINPRIIVFPRVSGSLEPLTDFVAIGFVRGERFVEIASNDPVTNEPNFYLLTFEQRCEYDASCDLASLLTEEIEHDWSAYSVYPETELENTSFDCLACHRPGGYGTKKILRMQELASPWLHWFPQRFVQRTDSDRVLGAQFGDIHGVDQQYGGIPVATIQNALDEGSGAQLEALIRAQGFAEQPNVFDPRIEAEAKAGELSATWLSQFNLAAQGQAIGVPYPRADVTDEAKRLAAVQSYKDVASGAAARGSLLDVRDVFSDDAREKLSFVPQPSADGRATLLQMCARCHDGRADPSIGRSRFNVLELDSMPRAARLVAAQRIKEPLTSLEHMPPWRAGQLTEAALAAALSELEK